jgi:uroporphyrinogen-III synthase
LPVAVTVTSGSTVRGLIALATRLGPAATEVVRGLPVIAAGGATAREAERHGLSIAAVASTPHPGDLADAAGIALGVHLEDR